MDTVNEMVVHVGKPKLEKIIYHTRIVDEKGIEISQSEELVNIPVIREKTHTFLFHKEGTNVFVTWSKPHRYKINSEGKVIKLDAFSKKTGLILARSRMNIFLSEVASKPFPPIRFIQDEKELYRFLPVKIARTFGYQIVRALRYFKIDSQDTDIYFKGLTIGTNNCLKKTLICALDPLILKEVKSNELQTTV